MNKKIKVIDLLNKIANGEEVPEKIKYDGFIWEANKHGDGHIEYYNDCDTPLFNQYLDTVIIDSLNNKVEIIEEQEEIDIQGIEDIKKYETETTIGYEIKDIAPKVNELIKAIKQLDNKLKGE